MSNESVGVLDHMLNKLVEHPRNFFLFFLWAVGIIFSGPAVIVGFIVFLACRFAPLIVSYFILALGLLLCLATWFFDGMSPLAVHALWHQLVLDVLAGSPMSYVGLLWLSAIPFGLMLGGVASVLIRWNGGISRELRRMGRGQHRNETRQGVSLKKARRLLMSIGSSATSIGTILGVEGKGNYACLSDKDANLHTLCIGTTGSGKTTTIANIIESAVLRKHPVIYVDGKGDLDLAKRLRDFAKSKQTPFYLFSMVGDESVRYNPISSGSYTSKKDRLIELREWSEDHYRKIAEGYLQTVFRVLERAQVAVDLVSLSQYLQPKSLYDLARRSQDKALFDEVEQLEDRWNQISSLAAEIENLARSDIGHLFDCRGDDVLTLEKALSENAVVYFCLSPLQFPAYAETLGKLIINDIKSLVGSIINRGETKKTFIILDEFSVFAGEQVINLINQGRGAGVHAVLATQSLSDIVRKGDDALLGQVINNTNNYIIQRQNHPEDAEILASVIGTEEKLQVTSQVQVGQGGTGMGSVRRSREYLVHPDDLKRLKMGEAILVNKQDFKVQRIWVRQGVI